MCLWFGNWALLLPHKHNSWHLHKYYPLERFNRTCLAMLVTWGSSHHSTARPKIAHGDDCLHIWLIYTGRKISASLSYVTVRGEGKLERTRSSKTPHALSLPLPPRTLASWPPTCVFVTVNEARRYLTTSITTTLSVDQTSYIASNDRMTDE
jgi:hypothetical protein